MCLILDADVRGLFMQKKASMRPVWNWLQKNGRIVFADKLKFKKEYSPKLIRALRRQNKLKVVSHEKVEAADNELSKILTKRNYQLRSKDKHIIVAALAGKAKLLVSEDRHLGKDFKYLVSNSSIYKNEEHSHLLDKHACP